MSAHGGRKDRNAFKTMVGDFTVLTSLNKRIENPLQKDRGL